jgi:hypothetical protein
MTKVAAASFMFDGGIALAVPPVLWHLARRGELPMTPWGFRALGGGPFERLNAEQFTLLGGLLAAVCVVNVLSGAWLWHGRPRGAVLGLAMTPLSLVLGWGFALPALLIPAPLRAIVAALTAYEEHRPRSAA